MSESHFLEPRVGGGVGIGRGRVILVLRSQAHFRSHGESPKEGESGRKQFFSEGRSKVVAVASDQFKSRPLPPSIAAIGRGAALTLVRSNAFFAA